jgi:hypothetical protein
MLMLGQVSTGLLRHSTSVSSQTSTRILRLRPGEPVRWSLRPIAYAVSPDVLTGVDCRLPTASGTAARGIGTVRSHAAVTGGRVLQGSAYAVLAGATTDRRLPWSHYLSRPGVVERSARVTAADLLDGFAAPDHTAGSLDLAAIASRTMDAVQGADELDGVPPLRTARTRLRWTAVTAEESPAAPRICFSIDDESRRTLTIRVPPHTAGNPDRVVAFCEDVALHDWLLTTLLDQIERGGTGADGPAHAVIRLRPAIEALVHLWMPAARTEPSLEPLWQGLERRPGFSRQWAATVGRIRDQLAVGGLALLAAAAAGTPV